MILKQIHSNLPGITIISREIYRDNRGYTLETFRNSLFHEHGLPALFMQDLISSSDKGIVRGLHYQLPPNEQGKFVEVLFGSIFDVVLDLRNSSKTFGQWQGFDLTSTTGEGIWIPPGFAHGFQSLQDGTIVSYKLTREYKPDSQRGILWSDPKLEIKWPIPNAIVSERDGKQPIFDMAETFTNLG